MAFSRPEYDDDGIQWDRIRATLEDADDGEPEEEFAVDGLASDEEDDDEEEGSEEGDADPRRRAAARPARAGARAGRPSPTASPDVQAKRLPRLKAAAQRIQKLKQVAVDPNRAYEAGEQVFDPTAGRFGVVLYSGDGYVRLRLSDGTESAHGKPPLEDRRAFIEANFQRMDNKEMAEILGISVHTMRRLCHEFGLKRQAKPKSDGDDRLSA